MTILYFSETDPDGLFEKELKASLPEMQVRTWPDVGNPADIDYAVTWGAPDEFYKGLDNLQAIFSLAAGVDHLLSKNSLPDGVPLIRLLDAGMGEKMAEYVLYGVLTAHRRFPYYNRCAKDAIWAHESLSEHAEDFSVGILGLGTLGTIVAHRLLLNGYAVHGWSRSEKKVPDVQTWHGDQGLTDMAAVCDVLVCLLPLTEKTHGILNQTLFSQCKTGCYLINVARGGHLVDEDLLNAIGAKQLSGALLDVTSPEPLPPSHAFWSHQDITLTPHVSAPTQHQVSMSQIVENIQRHQNGESMTGIVNRDTGY